jgi:hypothetical protein
VHSGGDPRPLSRSRASLRLTDAKQVHVVRRTPAGMEVELINRMRGVRSHLTVTVADDERVTGATLLSETPGGSAFREEPTSLQWPRADSCGTPCSRMGSAHPISGRLTRDLRRSRLQKML